MTVNGSLEAMGIVSESGALLLVRTTDSDGSALTIMIDATLAELDDLEERNVDVKDVWIVAPTHVGEQPVQLLSVQEILQPYFGDGERRDEVILRCASGALYCVGSAVIQARDPMLSCWRGRGRLIRRENPVLIDDH